MGEDPERAIERSWAIVAYCARYGGGLDVQDWSRAEARAFQKALSHMVQEENKANKGET